MALRGAGFDAGADPFDLAAEEGLAAVFLGLVVGAAVGAGGEVSAVVAFVDPDFAGIEFGDARGDAVEEVAVVGDKKAGVGGVGQVFFEPADGFGIEVVGGLVEEKEVGAGNEGAGEGDAAFFTTGEAIAGFVSGRAVEFCQGGADTGVEVPAAEVFDAG